MIDDQFFGGLILEKIIEGSGEPPNNLDFNVG